MTTQSNVTTSIKQVFRLQRLTKTTALRQQSKSEYEPKETFKLAAINSVSRGVKYSDISFISGRDLNKLRVQPQVDNDIQYQSAHTNLTGVRKSFDGVHRDKTDRDKSISKLKQEKRKLSIAQFQLKDNREKGQKSVKEMEQGLQKVKLLSFEAQMQKKVLANMKMRLKSDKIAYDQRKFDLEQELKFLKKQNQVLSIDKNDVSGTDQRTSRIYKKFVHQLNMEKNERDNHIAGLESMSEQRQRINQLNQFRNKQIEDIAERAMQDKDDSEINWQKLLMTNKLLSKLLRDKMDRQMQKFFVVETSFKVIKIATGVSDTQSLVSKFLNKEEAYGDLLGKIAENEKKIESLKKTGESLRKQFKQLEAEKETFEISKKPSQNFGEDMKKLADVDKRQQTSQIFKEKIRAWIMRTNKKMNKIMGKSYEIQLGRDMKSISTSFIQYLNNLSSEADQLQNQQIVQETLNTNDNIRIDAKPSAILRKKSSIKIEQQDEQHLVDQNEQNQIITGQRVQILKSNEKFMKEARKNFQEKKKIAAQSVSPKKKNQGQKLQVKKPQDD